MSIEKLKNKMAERASKVPVIYELEPKVPTKINVYNINYEIDPNQIVNKIYEFRANNEQSNSSNVRAWHTHWYLHKHENYFDDLIKIVENRTLDSLVYTKFLKVECTESWAVIYKKGDKTIRHKHFNQQYSAVYYAKAEKDAAPIIFNDTLSIVPVTGMLICFPGWLYHSVPEITDEQERVCMAFNLNCFMTENQEEL